MLIDAKAFQYKSKADSKGITGALSAVEKWDKTKSGVSLVWQRKDGKMFVADGHQRLELAKKLKSKGQTPKITGRIFREDDGWTQADMREIAAAKNIAEGTGTAWDAATVLRDSKDVESVLKTLAPKSALVRDAKGLAKLDDIVFVGAKANDKPSNIWAVIGEIADGDRQFQMALAQEFDKKPPASVLEAQTRANLIKADRVSNTVETTLFGDEEVFDSIYEEKSKLVTSAIKALKKDRSIFSALARNKGKIEGVEGNVLSDQNVDIAQEAAYTEFYITKLSYTVGPVSDALTKEGKEVKNGKKTFNKALADFITETENFIRQGESSKRSDGTGKTKTAPVTGTKKKETGLEAAAPTSTPEEIKVEALKAEPEPTEKQKEAGNYKKGHIKVAGFDVTIENAKGSKRSGTSKDGEKWEVKMPAHYGYFRKTTGADEEQVDVYVGGNLNSNMVFVVDQQDADTKEFDEHKVMMGFGNQAAAQKAYEAGFSDNRGAERIQEITAIPLRNFKEWLNKEDTTKPVAETVSGEGVELETSAEPEQITEQTTKVQPEPKAEPDTTPEAIAFTDKDGTEHSLTIDSSGVVSMKDATEPIGFIRDVKGERSVEFHDSATESFNDDFKGRLNKAIRTETETGKITKPETKPVSPEPVAKEDEKKTEQIEPEQAEKPVVEEEIEPKEKTKAKETSKSFAETVEVLQKKESEIHDESLSAVRNEQEQAEIQRQKEQQTAEKVALEERVEKGLFSLGSKLNGKGLSIDVVKKAVVKIISKWDGRLPKVEVVQTVSNLPNAIIKKAGEKSDDIRAVLWQESNEAPPVVYIVADKMANNKDIKAALAHEIIGHFGMLDLLGPDFASLLTQVWTEQDKPMYQRV